MAGVDAMIASAPGLERMYAEWAWAVSVKRRPPAINIPISSALMRLAFEEMIDGVGEFVLGIMYDFGGFHSVCNIISFQSGGKGSERFDEGLRPVV